MCTDRVATIQTVVFGLLYIVFFTCYEVGNSLYFDARQEIDPESETAMWLGFVPGTPWHWQTGGPFIPLIILIGNWIAKCTKNKTFLVCWGFFNLNGALLMLILTYAYYHFYDKYECPSPPGENPVPCSKKIIHYWNTAVAGGISCTLLHVWMWLDLLFWICCMSDQYGNRGFYMGEEARPLMTVPMASHAYSGEYIHSRERRGPEPEFEPQYPPTMPPSYQGRPIGAPAVPRGQSQLRQPPPTQYDYDDSYEEDSARGYRR